MSLRLELLPITTLPFGFAPVQGREPRPQLSCLLRCSSLPAGHTLDVRLNDQSVPVMTEGTDQVWVCSLRSAADTLRIRQLQYGKERAHWLGFWHSDGRFLERGTLPITRMIHGPLPVPVAADVPPTPPSQEPLDTPAPVPDSTSHEREEEVQENDQSLSGTVLSPPTSAEAPAPLPVQPTWEDCEGEGTDMYSSPAEPIVTALYLPVHDTSAEAWSELEALLAQLPASTLLVDLRVGQARPSRHRLREVTPAPLSKSGLRTQFGARYWDRSGAILLARPTETTHAWDRRASVTTTHPDGIPLLVEMLRQGTSLLFLDHSPRQTSKAHAVLDAVIHQCPTVHTLDAINPDAA